MHRILTFSLLVASIISIPTLGQQLPLYTQYVYDPYLINPSMVGYGGRPELNVLYRAQWTQIDNGPKTMQFDAQLPLNSRMAIGLNLYNDKTVLLSSTSTLLTFGYKIPLAKDHTLGFGLSAGVFMNQINLSEIAPADLNDPAILTASSNSMALNGQFGAHYNYKKLVIGFTLPNLFERKTFSPDNFQQPKFGQLQNQLWFASYRITIVPETWFIQPNAAYRHTQDNVNFYETSALVSYRNKVDIGGGYRQNFGPSAILRVTWQQLSIGVAYDFPSGQSQVSTGGSQEFQLKWRFARDEDKVVKKNSTPTPEEEEQEKAQPSPVEKKEEAKKVEPAVVPIIVAPIVVEKKPEVQQQAVPVQSQPKNEIVDDYYFVIGTFENRQNAEQFYNTVRNKGIAAELRESKPGQEPHFFYVHLPQYKSKEVTLDKTIELQKTTGFKDAWFTKLD